MTPATEAAPRTAYRVKAMSVEACSCAHGCNCQFGGMPNEGICEFVIGYQVRQGRFGDVDLGGVRAVVAAKYPNAIHEGHGHVVLFIDERASPEQVTAFTTVPRDPVPGQEKEVHISYPKGGFFWNDGNVVTTRTMRVAHGSLRMEWPSKYASTAEVNWTNAS